MRKTIFTKLSLSFLLAACTLTLSKAQSVSWQWARSAGSTGSEIAEASVLDPSGNLYVTGWYTSAGIGFGATTLLNAGAGTSDMYITKYDALGNVIWAKTFGGADGEISNCIAADASGDIYVSGWFTSPNFVLGTFTLTNSTAGKTDFFVAKINSSGNTVWAKSAGGTESDRGYGIALDASGNVFVTGGFGSSSINFGTGPMTNSGSATDDFFIVKYNSLGTTQWSRSVGGANTEAGLSVATDSLGNAYATGRFTSSSINFGTGSHNNANTMQDLFIVKYDAAGTTQWSFSNGGTGDDYGDDIMVNKQGVYITGGFTSSSVTFGSTTLNNAATGLGDVLLAKFNYSGVNQWAKKAGSSDMEWGYDVVSDAAGNIYLCGTFVSTTLPFGTTNVNNISPGYRDMFIASYDAAGNPIWATGAGGSFDEAAYGLAVNAAASEIYVAGFFNSPSVSFGTNTVTKGCGDDVVVAKMTGPTVGIKEEFYNDNAQLYPNPNAGSFKVKIKNEIKNGEFVLMNAIGQKVHSQKINEGTNEISVIGTASGIYNYVLLNNNQKIGSGKITIQ